MPKARYAIWLALIGLAIGNVGSFYGLDQSLRGELSLVAGRAGNASIDAEKAWAESIENAADIRYLMEHTVLIQQLQGQVADLQRRMLRAEPPADPPPCSENDPDYKAEIIERDGKLILQPAPIFRDQWKKRNAP